MGVLSIITASVEIEHLGDYANWRLGVAFFAVAAAAWGYWSFTMYELPASLLVAAVFS